MPSELASVLFLLNLPVFVWIQRSLFPDQASWQAALEQVSSPQYKAQALSGQWRTLLSEQPLIIFGASCLLLLFMELLILRAAFDALGFS